MKQQATVVDDVDRPSVRSTRLDELAPQRGQPIRRVLIVTASVGGGHDGPARELARQLTERNIQVTVVDLVRLGPYGTGDLLRRVFKAQLTWAPGTWGRWFDRLDCRGRAMPAPIRSLLAITAPRINGLLAAGTSRPAADLVVSTFPLGGHLLAAARRVGPPVPAVTYVTDPAIHRLWLAEGIRGYLTTWSEAAAQLGEMLAVAPGSPGGPLVRSVFPAVRPEFRAPRKVAREQTRRALALPHGPIALLCSGSWGVGQVLKSAVDVARCTQLTPTVVCGHNEGLRRRVARVPGVVALGWVDDMAGLMRVCQVAVLNSGGLTLAEAAVSGLPVVHYRPLPGQGVANARFGAWSGWSPYCRDATQLDAAIRTARTAPPRRLPTVEAADALIGMLSGTRTRPQAEG